MQFANLSYCSLLRSRVHMTSLHVSLQVILVFEAFATSIAMERSHCGMSSTMRNKITHSRKALATNVTRRTVCCIRVLHFAMITITFTRLESLVALWTYFREIVIVNRREVCHNGEMVWELGDTVTTFELGHFHSTEVNYAIWFIFI